MSQTLLSFAAQVTDLPGLTDSEFLQALSWDQSASPALRSAAKRGDVSGFCKIWQTNWRQENSAVSGTGLADRVLWSELAYAEEAGLARLIQQTAQSSVRKAEKSSHRPVNKPAIDWSQRVQPLISELTSAVSSAETRPFALLASLEFLVNWGYRLRPEKFFGLWRHTLSELLMWPTVVHDDPTMTADQYLLEHGEIPLVGGLLFRDVAYASNLVKSGKKYLIKQLIENTDTDGTPHAEILPRLPLWLAPLVRATLTMNRFEAALWNAEQLQLFTNLIDRSILLCRPDGRAALTNGLNLTSLPVLADAHQFLDLGLVGSTSDYLQAVQRAVAGKPPRRSRPAISTMASSQSDWAKFAFLRSDNSVDADSVAITHHQSLPQLDVTAMGRPLIHGDWGLKLKLGDAAVELAEEWYCICWQSDPDADYIELQMTGPGKLRVERVVMLSRKERFLFVADAISGISSSERGKSAAATRPRIEYESRLPICDSLVASCEGTTREGRIVGKRLKSRVFPLGIPQDRVLSTPHQLTVEGQELVLRHTAEGEGLFAPLMLVWHPERVKSDATWRTLTVTEEGKVVGPDVAVGYRLKLGKYQLLISRALKRTGNARACLGHHTRNETVIANFDANGDVEPILMVE